MENKVNVAKLLKDCPIGMELDCTVFEGTVILESIDIEDDFPIIIRLSNGNLECLTKIGGFTHDNLAKCVIFPKGETTWDGFQRPFKDGDIVACDCCGGLTQVFIFKNYQDKRKNYAWCYVMYGVNGNIFIGPSTYYITRYATEKEKQKLFKAIKDNGYKWDEETKTLRKLIEPKFKVGDIVQSKNCPKAGNFVITDVEEYAYSINIGNYKINFADQNNYELVSNKFDISALKPFDSRVLVRDYSYEVWKVSFWGCLVNSECGFIYDTTRGCYKQCIPFEGNEHLLGKTDDCDEYYKIWKT